MLIKRKIHGHKTAFFKENSALKRHFLKTISYRLLSTSLMMLSTYALGMSLELSAFIGLGELAFKPVVYFVHERFWYKYVSIGRKTKNK